MATVGAGAATVAGSGDDVSAALRVIQRDADAIAAGKYSGKSLQAPAHEIGVKWYEIEPTLAKNGAVLVEMRMANASITAFDKDWKLAGRARESAKNVSTTVGDLIAAAKSAGASPAASAAASPAPSTAPTGSSAPLSSASPEKPSPTPSAGH